MGGNWNNSVQCGAFYANLNVAAGNANTNIGASISCIVGVIYFFTAINAFAYPFHLEKVKPMQIAG